ncbi:hypothetical protein MAR_026891, partial [Mya arenaria]
MNGVTVVKDGSSDAIMREFHSSAIGGHSGFNKTNSAIKVRYWWPRMTEDIRKYVKLCVQCQMSDPMKPAKKPDLQQIHINKNLCAEWDVGHRVTAAYHPQTNGLDERTNQTIKRALSKCVNGGQTDWDTRLDQERESQQAETTEKVKINTEKAKFKQQRDFRNTHEKKKRRYTDIKVGDKVLKFNSARAGRKSKADLGYNYSGPYVVLEVVGHRVKLEKDGKILKSLVSVNNVKLVLDETNDNNSNLEQHDMPNNAIRLYIDNLDANNNVNSLLQECAAICNTSKSPVRMFRISKQVETCPVLSFVKEVTAMYGDLLPDMEDAVHRVKESGDPETLLLTVLAKAYMEDLPPVDVLETLKSRPAFLSECPKPEGLTGSERLTVAGDGLEQQDLNTLEGNEWLNDKALNSYAKLLAREATDSSEPSAKRMFVIPSYTAVLWDAGMYDRYMYTKFDEDDLHGFKTLECLVKGKASWILRQVHVPLFRRYITDRLLFKGQRNTYLCDSFWCKDPKGRKVKWVQCDVCYRWWHRTCCSKPDVTITNNNQFQCEVCDAQY